MLEALDSLSSGSTLLAPVFLYAEMHFRFFKGFPSLTYSERPEVVFDLPRRLAPGRNLPVLLLINDIDHYPALVEKVTIIISCKGVKPVRLDFPEPASFKLKHPLDFQSKAFLFEIERAKLPGAELFVNAQASLRIGSKSFSVLNDNLFGTSKAGFACLVAGEMLPGSSFCSTGDLHVHSQFSQSHVEFGPPITCIDAMAHASGLDFSIVTDHSYDLMCDPHDYLSWDTTGKRWSLFIDEIDCNTLKTLLIPGEEVSCLNNQGLVVHLLGLNLREALPGSFDGARKGRFTREQLTIQEASRRIGVQGGLVMAAHPGSRTDPLQRLFLRRGEWKADDVTDSIDGFQALNGSFSSNWKIAKALWIQKLQGGLKLSLVAGNDCHGDFNRYRFLHKPFLKADESFDHYFGASRTGVYGKIRSRDMLIKGLREGRTFVTNGPFIDIRSRETGESLVKKQDTPIDRDLAVQVAVESSIEFGEIETIRLFAFSTGRRGEECVLTKAVHGSFGNAVEADIHLLHDSGYVRAEVTCRRSDGGQTCAFTSPLYFRRG